MRGLSVNVDMKSHRPTASCPVTCSQNEFFPPLVLCFWQCSMARVQPELLVPRAGLRLHARMAAAACFVSGKTSSARSFVRRWVALLGLTRNWWYRAPSVAIVCSDRNRRRPSRDEAICASAGFGPEVKPGRSKKQKKQKKQKENTAANKSRANRNYYNFSITFLTTIRPARTAEPGE